MLQVDIEIRFVRRSHGRAQDWDREFDGPGMEIAHAFYPDKMHPLHGNIHFDTEEPWTTGDIRVESFQFRWAIIHEIGHSLGLEHSAENTSFMFPMYPNNYDPVWSLHEDDILGIRVGTIF